jgi:flagellar hook-basal body complex protein FliE
MVDPVSSSNLTPIQPSRLAAPAGLGRKTSGDADFATMFRQQLEQVNQMQAEAEEGVQNLLTGRTDSITEVLTTARKAEVAFSLLMEIRNKLVDAYTELKQLRV